MFKCCRIKMAHFIVFICLQLVFYCSCFAQDDNLVVHTTNGLLKGKLATTRDMQVRQFLGIPYAQPPVGELRFTKPKPFGNWEGIRDAVEHGPDCAQVEIVSLLANKNITIRHTSVPQSEDCLFLNVYTPLKSTPSDKLAVMVWIHGGAFEVGSGRNYNPSILVALYNVVVVTINYRLGVFGFFNIPDTNVKGNYGMHDQILALEWVQQNIAVFGGNPDQVTIYGESAGGMSVSSHLLSPLSKGLFHRVIAQSGSSVSPFSCNKVSSTQGLDVFKKAIQCDGDTSKIMECLRGKSTHEILTAKAELTKTMQKIGEEEYLTRPIVDGEYLTDDPRNLLQNRQINKAQVMLGATADESALFIFLLAQNAKVFDLQTFKTCTQPMLVMCGVYGHLGQEAVMMEYLGDCKLNDSDGVRQLAVDAFSDSLFLTPAVDEADLLKKAEIPVYMYVMDHQPHAPRLPKWLGAHHLLDLAYTFGLPLDSNSLTKELTPLLPGNFSALEEGFSKYVMQLWTNFAKYGNPNADGHMPVTWPRYNHDHAHLRLSTNPRIQHGLCERKVKFWNDFLPKLAVLAKPQNEASGSDAKKAPWQKQEL